MHVGYFSFGFGAFFFFVFEISPVFATGEWNTGVLTLKHEYTHISLNVQEEGFVDALKKELEETGKEKNREICLSEEENSNGLNQNAVHTDVIKRYLEEKVAPQINTEAKSVTISRDEHGNIIFEGYAQFGKKLNIERSELLIKRAIQNNIDFLTLSVDEISPLVIVEDEDLKKRGIQEVIAIGESDYSNSTAGRIKNVLNGASKFNGLLIPKGEIFSFNTSLGQVDANSGYVQEMIIQGEKVLPGYGGGLCQVSSTAYRGAMLAGFEIVERWNHSFAVSHYAPYGSDATIYQGSKDFQFKNDSVGDILLQTRHEGEKLFFIYYGTKDLRMVKIFGPYTSNFVGVPAAKHEYTADLPAGKKQKVSNPVVGFRSLFARDVIMPVSEKIQLQMHEDIFVSRYQARPLWIIEGIEQAPEVLPTTGEVARAE
jgi:vancomycin resistance protein YoaR